MVLHDTKWFTHGLNPEYSVFFIKDNGAFYLLIGHTDFQKTFGE